MCMPAEIEASILGSRKNGSYLIGIPNCEEWIQRVIAQLVFRATIQNCVMEQAMGKNDGWMPGVLGQRRLHESQRFLRKEWLGISNSVKHDAHNTHLQPEVTNRISPKNSKGSKQRI